MSSKKDYSKILILLISFSLTSLLFGQDQVKESLFKEANVLLKDAENVQASLYSPSIFQKGFELYARAEKDFKDGKKLDDIRKKLREASVQLKRSIEITRLSKLTLEELTTSRNAAVEQLSVDWAPVLFQEAEEIFRKAAEKVEDGKTNDAKKLATEGSKAYRNTELTAIKNRILNDAWTELQSCKEQEVEKYAPLTLEQAKTYAFNAESILDQDRYSQENAAAVASEATYEAKHALFLASVVEELQDKKEGLETYLLDIEQQFAKISTTLNLDLEFDGGFQNPAYKMVEAIVDLKEKAKGQKSKIQELTTTVDGLSEELTNLKSGQLRELSGKLSELEKIVAAEKESKARYERVKQSFSPEEAKVINEGENIIIRLYGIKFPSGKAIIHPEYFPLLTKVIRAIDEYQDAHVRIEGHTDSRGSNAVNEKLSSDRSSSVKQYVLANSRLDQTKVTGMGYGEDRPIASNDTEEGRSLNRRIDIVIIPGKSNY